MSIEDRLTFIRTPASLALLGKVGVEIAIGKEPSAIGNNQLWLHGQYCIMCEEALRIATPPLQKALVITCSSAGYGLTKNLVGNIVLFDDDETVTDDKHIGYFNYDLTDWINMHELRWTRYFVTVSLGRFISNTVQVNVNPLPIAK